MVEVSKMVTNIILVIIATIIIFQLISQTATDVTTAADNVSGSGLPFASFFGASGILLMLFVIGVFLMLMKMYMKSHGK